jgi:cytochrome b
MVKVWDLFVRLSHWLAVFLVISAWVSANYGDAEFKWHSWNGYALFVLVSTRIVWGVTGSQSARFTQFIKSPAKTVFYLIALLKGKSPSFLGHNPAGGWMVVVLLFVLLLQAITGIFSSDDILAEGPFAYAVSGKVVSTMTALHHLGFDLLVILVILHVIAVLYHQLIKKEKLIEAMFSGEKPSLRSDELIFFKPVYYALLILGAIALLFWLVLEYYT